jgi:hypothetical protein
MTQPTAAEVRSRWHSWAQNTLGGTPTQVNAATEAAMAAMAAGLSQEDVLDRARKAWFNGDSGTAAPAARAPTVPAAQPVERPRSDVVQGRVAGFQPRNEMRGRRYVTVWDFHVERPGQSAVAVEMRGYTFEGAIANGDEVQINRRPRGDRILHVRSLRNLTANSTVHVEKGPPHGVVGALGTGTRVLFKTVFFLIWLGVLIAIAYFTLRHFHKV